MFEKAFGVAASLYISLVHKTSKVEMTGEDILSGTEKYVVGFWHGESGPLYPVLGHTGSYIITTVNSRGSLIDAVGRRFGYTSIRLPDEFEGQNHIFKVRNLINGPNAGHLAMTVDGPLGPRHECKKLPLVIALASRRRFVFLSIRAKRRKRMNRRWDKFSFPLPFNHYEFHFHAPVTVTKDAMDSLREQINKNPS